MKNELKDLERLRHALEAISNIESFFSDSNISSFEQFQKNKIIQSAVEYQFVVIGEALRCLSEDSRAKHAELIPFREIIGMRNLITHDYLDVDLKSLWDTCQVNLPQLKKSLLGIIK